MSIHSTHKKDLCTSEALSKVSAGFTLIELVVVMAIIGIMVAVVSFSFGNESTKKALETNAREFASVLREAQNYALTGKQIGSGVTCRFDVTWTTTDYSLKAMAKSGSGLCDGTGTVTLVSTYSLKQGATFMNGGNISFLLPWGVSSGTMSAVLSRTGTGMSHVVCLNASGKVVDQEGSTCPQ